MHVIGTAGHVDHGKSTLVQRLTGIDPDRFEEEKRRGLTIDLGFAWLSLPSGLELGIVDVPGHERFIKNMLAGAGGITVCLFVVAAPEGWMPQSAEHLAVLDVLGVRAGVVAVTKSDAVDAETLELAVAEVEEKLEPSSLRGAPIVTCSGLTGDGLDRLVAELDRVVQSTPPAPDLGRPRLWIDRVFTISGAGTVVTGTLAGGAFSTAQEVEITPEGRRARIRAIQSHKKEVERIGPGNRTALNLVGLERQGAERGDAVVEAHRWRPTRRIDAEVRVVGADISGREHELSEKGAHLLYVGSAETPVRVKLLDRDVLVSGEPGFAQLYLRDALPLARGDRFVLRDAGRVLTFGGGTVLDPLPELAKRGDPERLSLLERLKDADGAHALTALIEAKGSIVRAEAALRAGTESLTDEIVVLGDSLVSPNHFEELRGKAVGALESYHSSHPLEPGMPRERLRAAIRLDPRDFDALVDRVEGVVAEEAIVRLISHGVSLSPEQERARDGLLATIESAGLTPPLTKELDVDPELLQSLSRSGELVRIGDFHLTRRQAKDIRVKVRDAIVSRGPVTVAEIRDLLGTSRKYAVPLCEWLDQTGATIRRGDTRVLGPTP
jgi:selenocysteine-specific elongation factor